MPDLTSHLRYAVRQLRHNPSFALTAVLTLAIGIGATTAIFSIFYAVLLRPLPYQEPERLVRIVPQVSAAGTNSRIDDEVSYPNFRDWRDQAHSFDAMASYHGDSLVLNGIGQAAARNIQVGVVSADFFRVLRIAPALGRDFQREEEKQLDRVVVLSHELWASDFDSSPSILGQTVKLSGELYTVIGVLPAGASFPFASSSHFDLWTTPVLDSVGTTPSVNERGWTQLDVMGRLKRGVGPRQAEAEMNTIQRGLAEHYRDTNAGQTAARIDPILDEMVGDVRFALRVLLAAVGALLLIACANVAGLFLARGSSRRAELTVRAALGAGRTDITLQLLTESLLISVLGGLGGVLIAALALQGVVHFIPRNLPRVESIGMNMPVLLFAIAVSLASGIVFGILPARRLASIDPALALRENTRTSTAGRKQSWLHSTLVVAETALSLMLLVGAGLLARSFVNLLHTEPGFNPRNVLTFRLGLAEKNYPAVKRAEFFQRLGTSLNALPGAQSSSAAFPLPFSGGNMSISFDIQGHPATRGNHPDARATLVTDHYFETLEIPLLRGRFFTPHDHPEKAAPVIIVNEALARKYFPGEEALGKHIQTGFDGNDFQGVDGAKEGHWREIVGVVRDVKRVGLAESAKPEYYIPFSQAPVAVPFVALRVAGDPAAYANTVTETVHRLDREVPVYRIQALSDNVAGTSAQQRFQTLLLASFAGVALLLAAIGLYGVLSYMVVQRTHEIGLRMALGAQRQNVLQLILRRGLTLALFGLAFGLGISIVLTRYLGTLLYQVKPLDPLTFILVAGLLLLVSTAASLVPATRAASLEPMKTLRDQ